MRKPGGKEIHLDQEPPNLIEDSIQCEVIEKEVNTGVRGARVAVVLTKRGLKRFCQSVIPLDRSQSAIAEVRTCHT